MLTWFRSAICTTPPAAPAQLGQHRVSRPGVGGGDAARLRADDPAKRMRALAESCTDGLAALAYAQFADVLDPRGLRPYRALEPPARSR
jgi:hypothetical protein